MTSSDGGRRGLQITLGALAAIPLASGLVGALAGPGSLRWRLLDALPAVTDDELAEVLGRG